MDLQSFIQSGLLEYYALGRCTPEERALVERMLAGHAEARAELAAIEKALEGYAATHGASPPAWMKGRILEIIENEQKTPDSHTPPSTTSPAWPRVFLLLAFGLALFSGFLYLQNRSLNSEKTTLENRADTLQQQLNACEEEDARKEKLQQVNRLLRDRDDTRMVALSNGKDGKFTAFAYINAARCEVAIDLNSLPAPDAGKYLQLWSIVDGTPVSMGMVDLKAAEGWQVIPCKSGAAVLAISQENNPNGNPAPTEVLMTGNIPPTSG